MRDSDSDPDTTTDIYADADAHREAHGCSDPDLHAITLCDCYPDTFDNEAGGAGTDPAP